MRVIKKYLNTFFILAILDVEDLSKLSSKQVRKSLEAKYEEDLSGRYVPSFKTIEVS